ncbi:MAG: hypothetical protein O3A25_03775 [Acidobacteria bacterium]|nr:hypothetical protein [Acidobacteriota bacterium]
MGGFFRIPVIRFLRERQLLLLAVLLLVVCGVLAQGAFVRTQPVEALSPDADPAPTPPPLVRRPNLEKTPLTYFDDYWGQLRARVEDSIVLVGPESVPAVVVLPGLAVSSAEAGEAVLVEEERGRLLSVLQADTESVPDGDQPTPPAVVGPDGARAEPRGATASDGPVLQADAQQPVSAPPSLQGAGPYGLIAVDRDSGVALFEVGVGNRLLLVPPAAVPSGSYVGAVTRDRAGRASIAPGHLVAARTASEPSGDPSLAVSMTLSGWGATAIVNLDGALVGVAVGGADPSLGPRLFSSSAIRQVVTELQRRVPCRPLRVTPLDPEVQRLLTLDAGLLIEEVRQAAFRPEPSLRAGDVLLEWGGEPVTTVDAFERRSDALAAGAFTPYRVLRGRQRLIGNTILPASDCRPTPDPPVPLLRYGVALRWADDWPQGPAGGWRVVATVDGGPAAVAGLHVDDLLLAVDGRPVAEPDPRLLAQRLPERGGSVIVTLRRDDHVRMVALVPDRADQ